MWYNISSSKDRAFKVQRSTSKNTKAVIWGKWKNEKWRGDEKMITSAGDDVLLLIVLGLTLILAVYGYLEGVVENGKRKARKNHTKKNQYNK